MKQELHEVYTDLEHQPKTFNPLEEIKQMVDEYENDAELGLAIRKFINKYHV